MPWCRTGHGMDEVTGPHHWKALWYWLDTMKGVPVDHVRQLAWQTWELPGGGLFPAPTETHAFG